MPQTDPPGNAPDNAFAQQAEQSSPGLVREFVDFLKHNKKWWLLPILIVLLGMGALLIFASMGGAAPFIYTLF